MDPRTRRSPARFLAPLALIAVVIAFFAIIGGSGGGSGNSSSDTTGSSTSATTTTSKSGTSPKSSTKATRKKAKSAGPSTYTVQVGDTLGAIADKTGVPLSKIQELNPDVDPHAMVAGQQIKLK